MRSGRDKMAVRAPATCHACRGLETDRSWRRGRLFDGSGKVVRRNLDVSSRDHHAAFLYVCIDFAVPFRGDLGEEAAVDHLVVPQVAQVLYEVSDPLVLYLRSPGPQSEHMLLESELELSGRI